MKAKFNSLSDKGKEREHNEDYFLNDLKYGLFMIADGMGGYECGDIASQLALTSIVSYLDSCTNQNGNFSEKKFNFAIDYANRSIFDHKQKNKIKNMGTTFLCVAQSKQGGVVFHVGDSRLYIFRNQKLDQITQDHSAEQEVLPDFMMNASGGKYSSVLTRALGTHEKVAADSVFFEYKKGDILLLCSDGLYSMVPDDIIISILSSDEPVQKKCQNLIDIANGNGGEDNITVTLIEIEDDKNPDKPEFEKG